MSASVQAAFGLFDDDDSSDDEQQVPVNTTLQQLSLLPPAAPVAATASKPVTIAKEDTRVLYPPWDDVRPLTVGPIELISSYADIGGQRGYVASRDLEPGTVVLVEQVYVPWPQDVEQSDPVFFIATLESILSREDYEDILQHLSYLHPQCLDELPEPLLAAGRAKYSDQIDELLDNFASLSLSHDAMLQKVFAMQCNAFDSGVFLYNAIFNHECNPNCIKFTPESSGPGVSEVRVTRKILKGEPLSISYLYPRERSLANRQQNLLEQFGFECSCALCQRGDSILPPPAATTPPEHTVDMIEVEKALGVAEEMLKDKSQAAQALHIALESLSDALEIVAHDHIVLIRLHKLVADCCDVLLRQRPSQDVREYAILFLRSSYELLELQRTYLNADHMDLARTLNDVSQGIQLLLSYDPKVLLEEFAEWESFRQASSVENEYRKEYRRIKRLYE